ncbi:MAG: ATP-binding protein [Myxococcota bacterium]
MAEGGEHFRFELPARLEYRDAVRGFLTYICDQLTKRSMLTQESGHQLVSAFVEAFNNAVVHAYRGLEPGPVEVELHVGDDDFVMRISDYGRTFRLDDVREPDLDSLPEGGLGLFIIRKFMDEVHYEAESGRNVLHMTKALSVPNEDAS